MTDPGPTRTRSASYGTGLVLLTTLRIRNVVASITVAGSLGLDDLAAAIPGATLDRRFPRLVLRLSVPKATALVFGSGKIVFTGLGAPEAALPATEAVLTVLRGAGARLDEPVPAAKTANLVASGTLGERIALHRLAVSRNLDRVEFDPELFPGLVYRSEAGGVALIFGTGSVVITGTRSIEEARAVAAEVESIVTATGVVLAR